MASQKVEILPAQLSQFKEPQPNYSSMQHAAWRCARLAGHQFFCKHAHPAYIESVKMLLIPVDTIPDLYGIVDKRLNNVNFGTIIVNGFIPPRVFMDLQSRGIMPVSGDMRTPQNLGYTPSPDILHEGLGHLAMLSDPEFRELLQKFGELGKKAKKSSLDQENYEAIRNLSILEEDPTTSAQTLKEAREKVIETGKKANENPSEAAKLARLYWWTIEYGLVMHDGEPKIFGAGLISSIEEAKNCLTTKHIPLTLKGSTERSYDITRQQGEYFVAKDWKQIMDILNEFESTMIGSDIEEKDYIKPSTRTRTSEKIDSELNKIYHNIRTYRQSFGEEPFSLEECWNTLQKEFPEDWLAAAELLELMILENRSHTTQNEIINFLEKKSANPRLSLIIKGTLERINTGLMPRNEEESIKNFDL